MKNLWLIISFFFCFGFAKCQDINAAIDSFIKTEQLNCVHNNLATKRSIFTRLIDVYKRGISPIYSSNCAFKPSCSQYSKQAFESYNPVKALFLSFDRLTRCHPRARQYNYKYNFETERCIDYP